MKLKVDFSRVLILVGVAALLIIYAVLWQRMITSRAERTGADFIAFYAAGRVAQSAGASQVYSPELQQAIQQEQVGFKLVPGQVLLYNHVPYLIPLLTVLVNEDYIGSFMRWGILLVIVYALSAGVIGWLFVRKGFKRNEIVLLVAGMLTFFPVFVSVLNGQDTALLFLGACLWLAGLLFERDPLAGLGLALTTVRPNIALLLALPFLFHRQRVFFWFCLGSFVLGLISLLVLGIDGMRSFVNILLATAGGNWYGMKESVMLNLIGLLLRATPWLNVNAVHGLGWGAYFLSLVGLCIIWAKSSRIAEKQAGLALVLAVFTVPHLHYHDLTLLLIPFLAILLLAKQNGLGERFGGPLLLGVSLLFLFSTGIPLLYYSLPYLGMAVLMTALVFPGRFFHIRQSTA